MPQPADQAKPQPSIPAPSFDAVQVPRGPSAFQDSVNRASRRLSDDLREWEIGKSLAAVTARAELATALGWVYARCVDTHRRAPVGRGGCLRGATRPCRARISSPSTGTLCSTYVAHERRDRSLERLPAARGHTVGCTPRAL